MSYAADYGARWRATHREEAREYARRYAEENRGVVNDKARRYRQRNRVAIKVARDLSVPIAEARRLLGGTGVAHEAV